MSAVLPQGASTDGISATDYDSAAQSVPLSHSEQLKLLEQRADLDAQHIQLLQARVTHLEGALALEQARGEKHAEAFMEVARASDNRARELEAQYTAKLAKLEVAHDMILASRDATTAAKDATIAAKDAAIADLKSSLAQANVSLAKVEAENDVLKADAAAQLATIHAAVTSKLALEIHPVRRDRRQFATLHLGPVPFDAFDIAWCAAACGEVWKVDIDPVTHMRAHVTQGHRFGSVTLRGAAPLPRRLPPTGASPQQLPSYRVIIEAYPEPVDGRNTQFCNVGFLPSHTSTDSAPIIPVVKRSIRHFGDICHYGGWWFQVHPTERRELSASIAPTLFGWKPLSPRAVCAGEAAAADSSAYATTDAAPPVPAGSAVELAMDYAAGTCRVAFYTPAAVEGGFEEAPYAKMELRFVATAAARRVLSWGAIPERAVPTAAADSLIQLYPAVSGGYAGTVCRFV
jgi:hypothetical protein